MSPFLLIQDDNSDSEDTCSRERAAFAMYDNGNYVQDTDMLNTVIWVQIYSPCTGREGGMWMAVHGSKSSDAVHYQNYTDSSTNNC